MKKRVLFICSRNKWRSPTAQELFRDSDTIEADSAGTEKGARVMVEPDHVGWADVIYVMEVRHAGRLKAMFGPLLKGKRIVVLGIPDIYGYMDPALIETLRAKLKGLG